MIFGPNIPRYPEPGTSHPCGGGWKSGTRLWSQPTFHQAYHQGNRVWQSAFTLSNVPLLPLRDMVHFLVWAIPWASPTCYFWRKLEYFSSWQKCRERPPLTDHIIWKTGDKEKLLYTPCPKGIQVAKMGGEIGAVQKKLWVTYKGDWPP